MFCVSVRVKLSVLLLGVHVLPGKAVFQNDLYCVGRDVKPYSGTQCASLPHTVYIAAVNAID